MTAEERAERAVINYETAIGSDYVRHPATLKQLIEQAIIEAMKDQREACAEAVQATDLGIYNISTIIRRQAVLSAEPKTGGG